MSDVNKTFLLGNLTRDPDSRQVQFGGNTSTVVNFGLAVNSYKKQGQKEVTFIDITVWGKTAENCVQYIHKGSKVFIDGRLKLDTWQDKQTGQKRSKLSVVAEKVVFLDKPQGQQVDQYYQQAQQIAQQQYQQPVNQSWQPPQGQQQQQQQQYAQNTQQGQPMPHPQTAPPNQGQPIIPGPIPIQEEEPPF